MFRILMFSACLFTQNFYAQNFVWSTSSGSTSVASIQAIRVDAGGNSYVTGTYAGNATFGSFTIATSAAWVNNCFVAKYSSSGSCIWVQPDSTKFTGIDIGTDSAINCYVLGYLNGQYTLTKWDSSGSQLWTTLMPLNITANDLVTNANGDCWIAGRLNSGQAIFGTDTLRDTVGVIARYDSNGNAVGAISLGRHGKIDPLCICIDINGDYVVAARLSGTDTLVTQPFSFQGNTLLMIKMDSGGSLIWTQVGQAPTPGNAWGDPFDLCLDAQGNSYVTFGCVSQYFVFGSDTVYITSGQRGSAVIKFDTGGNVAWITQTTTSMAGTNYFQDITCDANGVYFSGYTSLDFTLGTMPITDTSNAYYMLFVIGLDYSGVPLFERCTYGNNSIANPQDIAVDNAGGIWLGGFHRNGPHFGPFALPPAAPGADDAFLVKIQTSGLGIHENVSLHEVDLFPGQESGTFNLSVGETVLAGNTKFVLYDLSGRIVKTIFIRDAQTTIDCRDLAGGVYTWSVENSGERLAAGKIINQ